MTLEGLLQLARDGRSLALASAVLELLGEAQPCGFEPPVVDPGMVTIMDGTEPAYQFDPPEARAYAVMLLRAADEAEALS